MKPGSRTPFQKFLSHVRPDTPDVIRIWILAFFNALVQFSVPLGIQAIVSLIAAQQMPTSWYVLTVLVVAGVALTGLFQIMQMALLEKMEERIFVRNAFDFAWRLPRLRMAETQNVYLPEITNRFFETLSIQKGLSKIIVDFSTSAVQIVLGILVLGLYHPAFIILGLVLITVLIAALRITSGHAMNTSLNESKYKYELVGWLEELARNSGTFKLGGEPPLPLSKTDDLAVSYLHHRRKHFRVLLGQKVGLATFNVLLTLGLIVLGGLLVVSGDINLGQFVAAEIIIILIMSSTEKILRTVETIYDVLTSAEKLSAVEEMPLEDRGGSVKLRSEGALSIEARELSFVFPESGRRVFEPVSFKVKAGESVCISGDSGSGKTTLLALAAGLFPGFSGSLLIEGLPLSNLQLDHLRSRTGTNLRYENLFKGTIMENITLGMPQVTEEDVWQAAEASGLHEYVTSLSEGYDTMIDPEGRRLPEHALRKILLTRALARKPGLLLIEDQFLLFTQADRQRIVQTLTSPDAPWTLIIVSNSADVIERCDQVVTLKKESK